MVVFRLSFYGDLTLKIAKHILRKVTSIGLCDLYLTPNLRIAIVKQGESVPNDERGLRPHFVGTFDYRISDADFFDELWHAINEVCPNDVEVPGEDERSRHIRSKLDVPIEDGLVDCGEDIALVDTVHSLRYGAAHTLSDDAFRGGDIWSQQD